MAEDTTPKDRDTGRRNFFKRVGRSVGQAALGGGLLTGFLQLRKKRTAPIEARGRLGLLRPPGAVDEADFLAKCIRCTRCSDACEAQCILLFGPEGGKHQSSPYIFSNEKGCTMCLQCGEACPTGALVPLAEQSDVKMGVAVVDERLCVSHNGTGVCGACHTVCPLRNKAIVQDFRNAPLVDPDFCTGCGLCEEICIVRDRRAIQVKTDRAWDEEVGV
ncbi:MAG: 4Fe-4S dicluster domain-containing protein [Candidatus Latescibacteria bacterium]|nr:4Fe-4S dicluster domain-containing protein [Candidatus Latescibacterota bacterium]